MTNSTGSSFQNVDRRFEELFFYLFFFAFPPLFQGGRGRFTLLLYLVELRAFDRNENSLFCLLLSTEKEGQ